MQQSVEKFVKNFNKDLAEGVKWKFYLKENHRIFRQ